MAVQHNVGSDFGTDDAHADWRRELPTLSDGAVTLRQLAAGDASSLLAHLNDAAVLRYIAPCPATVAEFRKFISWTHAQRRQGRHACFGIVPRGAAAPVGIVQVWSVETNFATAEWGFVLGRSYWGTGLFVRSARLLLDAMFLDGLFGPPGVFRLEARAVEQNLRGNGMLKKLGATADGLLRGAFHDGDRALHQVMWSILAPEWPTLRSRLRLAS